MARYEARTCPPLPSATSGQSGACGLSRNSLVQYYGGTSIFRFQIKSASGSFPRLHRLRPRPDTSPTRHHFSMHPASGSPQLSKLACVDESLRQTSEPPPPHTRTHHRHHTESRPSRPYPRPSNDITKQSGHASTYATPKETEMSRTLYEEAHRTNVQRRITSDQSPHPLTPRSCRVRRAGLQPPGTSPRYATSGRKRQGHRPRVVAPR